MIDMKIITIDKCEECPYFEYAYTTDNFLYVCENINTHRKGIDNKNIIQEWCLLEDNKTG